MKKYLIKEETLTSAAAAKRICGTDCNICNPVFETIEKVKAMAVGETIELDPNSGVGNELIYRLALTEADEPEKTFFEKVNEAEDGRDNDLCAIDAEDFAAQHESLMDVVAAAPIFEGEFVLGRLRRGKVDGGTFGEGDRKCSCLLGTMATACNAVTGEKKYNGGDVLADEMADLGVQHRDAQALFGGINIGSRPSNSKSAAVADQFITELLMSNRAALGREERVALRKLARAMGHK